MEEFCFKESDFIFIGYWGEIVLRIRIWVENINEIWFFYLVLFLIIKLSFENVEL